MASNIECPTDFVLVNENKIRLTALSALIIAVMYLITGHWILPAFLVIDFFLRAFNFGRYSILNLISENLVNIFNISAKPIDQAPKRFAAKVGFIFSVAILILTLVNYTAVATLLAIILAVFAFLESFIGFCAGCYVYSFYIRLFKKIECKFQSNQLEGINPLNKIIAIDVFHIKQNQTNEKEPSTLKTALQVFITLFFCILAIQYSKAQQQKNDSSSTENYYKTKWGYADEFIELWKMNHYPLLKKAIEKGDIISVTAEKPRLHSGEDTRWDFKVTIVFKNAVAAFDPNLTESYKKLIYPDLDKLKKDEQHRFELLLAHWDVMSEKISLQ